MDASGPRGPLTDLLVEGDCGEVAGRMVAPGSAALAYMDPPFGTGRAQPYLFGMGKQERPYPDPADPVRWMEEWTPRIEAVIGTLRPGGILVLHLDPRLAPRARVMLEDPPLASRVRFLNEIIWHYRTGGVARDRFAAKHDTLIVYRRDGAKTTFHALTERRYLAHRANRPGVEEHRDGRGWYRYARIDDVWEIPFLPADSRERVGYPTQKPEALVERLVLAFTEVGDLVVDFTCGSGTCPAVAARTARRWIASDLDARAIASTAARLARLRSADLALAWDHAGIEGRRGDLRERIARMRGDPESYGLTPEEAVAASIRIQRAPAAAVEGGRCSRDGNVNSGT